MTGEDHAEISYSNSFNQDAVEGHFGDMMPSSARNTCKLSILRDRRN